MHSREVLIEASEHLHYEVWMLRLTAHRLAKVASGGPSHDQSTQYAFTHTTHVEVSMYSSNAPITPPSDEEVDVSRVNSDIESFALHLRAILDFFCKPMDEARPGDLLAEHFFAEPEIWRKSRPFISTNDLESIRRRVGKEIAHLTQARLFLTIPQKLWPFLELKRYALDAADAFVKTVDQTLLSDKWKPQSA
jgi:hypothetical protein